MRKIICSVIALALASFARADVSDSGNLTIGGNGVIQGTMTVQGGDFSVGGATFSVSGGSITFGGRLNASTAGIKWADGSTSTTSASAGGGNAVLAATQTFSGANTFTSTTTVGLGADVQVLNYSAALRGGWSQVGSYNIAGSSFAVFSNFDQRFPHRVHSSVYSVGAAWNEIIRFNGDLGGNCSWQGSYVCQGGGIMPTGLASQDHMNIIPAAGVSGTTVTAHFDIFTIRGGASGKNKVGVTILSDWANAVSDAANGCSFTGSASYYPGTVDINRFEILSGDANAKMYGWIYVEAFVPNPLPAY